MAASGKVRKSSFLILCRYKVGMTLRFPRLEKVRDDKEWYDCMTTTELDELRAVSHHIVLVIHVCTMQIASGRLTHQHADGGAPSAKRRKVTTRIEQPRGVAAQFKQVDTSKLEKVLTTRVLKFLTTTYPQA